MCVHVECSSIVRVVDGSILYSCIDAYVVEKGRIKEVRYITALAFLSSNS
jgi:hypothetical protein